MNLKFFGIFLMFAISATLINSCNDFVDIYSFYHTLYDYTNLVETNIRTQYNTFHADRLKAISTQLNTLKVLQNAMPNDMCKYGSMDIEDSLSTYQSLNELINNVKYNGLYAAKSALDDLRNDQLNLIFSFINSHVDLVDQISLKSKNFFLGGKQCVMSMDKELQNFFDTTTKKFMDCLRSAFLANNLQPPGFKTHQYNLTSTLALFAYNVKLPLYGINSYSSIAANATAVKNFNTFIQGMFPTVLDIIRQISFAVLDLINAIESHNRVCKFCITELNSTVVIPAKKSFLYKIEEYCAKK